ncbi:hypothetical protein [Pseudopedobacter beijingensis]|uniref:Uncharacterized protein n=1 Tax=Pseudopedobacter beijingensis TaxID=1207056 RepID=A0ABW4IE68_9SPHI
MIVFFENLRIGYYPNIQQLKIQNSLHRFFNRTCAEIKTEGSYNDFKLIDFCVVCYMFSEFYFERSLEDFKLSTRFETGVNVDCGGYKPMEIMQRYNSYQAGTSIVDFQTIEPYGSRIEKPTTRKVFLSDYQLKSYDKAVESKLSGRNLLRYEIVYGQIRKIRSVLGTQEINLGTLCKWENWKLLGDYLVETYSRIKKLPLITSSKLTIEEINMIHAVSNKHLRKDLSTNLSRHYYSKYLNECKTVYNRISVLEDNYHEVMHKKIADKVKLLYTNGN